MSTYASCFAGPAAGRAAARLVRARLRRRLPGSVSRRVGAGLAARCLLPGLFAVTIVLLAGYVRVEQVDVAEVFRRRWRWSLGIGVVLAVFLVINVFNTEDATARPHGAYFVFELLWRGVGYGLIDTLLLTVFPCLVAYQLLRGHVGGLKGKLRFTALTLPLVIVVTATYHLPQYRQDGVGRPETGNILISIPTFATRSGRLDGRARLAAHRRRHARLRVAHLRAARYQSVTQIGQESYTPERRFLSERESVAVAVEFRRGHPRRLRPVARILGWGDLSSDSALREFVRSLPFVSFRPATPPSSAPRSLRGRCAAREVGRSERPRSQRASSESARRSGSARCGGSKWWRSANVSSVKSAKIADSRSAIGRRSPGCCVRRPQSTPGG